jgi:hypothetical protein
VRDLVEPVMRLAREIERDELWASRPGPNQSKNGKLASQAAGQATWPPDLLTPFRLR